jgi:hypothetical protein
MSERTSRDEKARIRREYRLLAAQIHQTEEGRASLAGLNQLITKNNELYSNVSKMFRRHWFSFIE